MTPSPRSDRPRVYADEDIDRPLIEALQARGFDVLTVTVTRSFGEDDPAQLERTLTDGYARALALEAERWRLQQRHSLAVRSLAG